MNILYLFNLLDYPTARTNQHK